MADMPTEPIGCFDPAHHDGEADVIARDEMVGCLVGFCNDHADRWLSLDHITEVKR